jgi:hypothetical protein
MRCREMMLLFANMHTCCYGSETTKLYGIPGPSVHDYLFSVNNGLMV